MAKHTLEMNNLEQGELDWLVPHQANERIILAIAKKINLPKDKIIITVNTWKYICCVKYTSSI